MRKEYLELITVLIMTISLFVATSLFIILIVDPARRNLSYETIIGIIMIGLGLTSVYILKRKL
ncbi:MAG TPA: hypothetical protein VJ824_06355 [Bacillota bacterium]|nr:hypothetical protein [Bacillota bacterium]